MPEFDIDAALAGPPQGRVLERPMTEAEAVAQFRELGHVEGIVVVDLDDIFEQSYDSFLDDVSAKLCDVVVGSIDYEVIGVTPPGTLFVKVTAGEIDDLLIEDVDEG